MTSNMNLQFKFREHAAPNTNLDASPVWALPLEQPQIAVETADPKNNDLKTNLERFRAYPFPMP